MPDTIQFTAGHQNYYTYDASGKKLEVQNITSRNILNLPQDTITRLVSSTKLTTDYCGDAIYQNDTLKEVLTPEGYWQNGLYYYYLKDHQGSTREVLRQDNTVMEYSDYYPDGMRFWTSTSNSGALPYRYNGKEMEAMNGLNEYDYGARRRETGIPVWTTMDPLAEKYYGVSPYVYCAGNPMNLIDLDGQDWYKDKDGTYQYDPNINDKSKLAEGQAYVGETYTAKDEKGNVTAQYRKDGSILYSNQKNAFSRLVNNAVSKDREEMAVITPKGTLVTPDYKNTALNAAVEEYGYSFENGNIKDKDGNMFQVEASVHTHFAEGVDPQPSGRTIGNGDIQYFSMNTPNKPFLTLGRDGNVYGSIGYYDKNENLHWSDLPYSEKFRVYNLVHKDKYLNQFIYRKYIFK